MKTVEDLKSLQAQAILRLNCPGFGGSSLLTMGQARPLTEYKVIVVNPISIVHLFEEDAALTRQIDMAQAEGLTSCKLSDDGVIERISQQIEGRSPELFQFLAEGGLLIYYLCRPFVISSDNRSMDNYAWLCGLAPDQSGESTMSEQTVRHMSTVAHGRNIDKCEAASESEFEKYLEQGGLEWNTIIRTDFLTSGYNPLAQAGPKKCIAGELIAGDNGGRVVFLPAPYSPDFDRVLIDCINLWHAIKLGYSAESAAGLVSSSNGAESAEKYDDESPNASDKQESYSESQFTETAFPQSREPESSIEQSTAGLGYPEPPEADPFPAESSFPPAKKESAVKKEDAPSNIKAGGIASKEDLAGKNNEISELQVALDAAGQRSTSLRGSLVTRREPKGDSGLLSRKTNAANENQRAESPVTEVEKIVSSKEDIGIAKESVQASADDKRDAFKQKSDESAKIISNRPALNKNVPEAQKNREEPSEKETESQEKTPRFAVEAHEEGGMSDWCNSYWLPGMDNIFKDIQAIRKQIRDLEKKLVTNEDMVSSLEEVKSTLLSGKPGDLLASCKVVLENLGWNAEPNGHNELALAEEGHPLAVVRVAVSTTTPERSELARLTESLINFWDSQGNEPKGVLIACTYCDTPITQRKEPDFSNIMLDFATKKNICLISTTQIISIYLDMKLGKIDASKVRAEILSTAGALRGFKL